MKKLSMRKISLGGGYYRYEVMQGEYVIATRVSRRDYVSAFVVKAPGYVDSHTDYKINKMFGRKDLLAQAMRKTPASELYAIAELTLEMH